MKQSEAWVLQARSDFAAAERVCVQTDASTYCQAIAKYQQTVEKSVKAMTAAINELGVVQISISGNHTLEHEIKGLDAVRRKKRDVDNASLEAIDRIFRSHKADIARLCALAPKLPKAGDLYPRNTEYPFNSAAPDDWTAPAAPNVFTIGDVRRARDLAWPLHRSAATFASSLRRRR